MLVLSVLLTSTAFWPLADKAVAFEDMKGTNSKEVMECPHLRMKSERRCPYTTKYQELSGLCHNNVKSDTGATLTPFRRVLPADYADGIQLPRRARDGNPLPNARKISSSFKNGGVALIDSLVFSHMFVQVGQYLAHDTANTTPEKEKDQTDIECDCNSSRPECIKIEIPEGDEIFDGRRECIPLVRSAPKPGTSCSGKPRQQVNSITAFWDGNTVYGSDDDLADVLRDPVSDKGEMLTRKSENGPREDSLPIIGQIPEHFKSRFACPKHLHANKSTCFAGGEARLNENQGLMCMHMIFLREHNRIARELKHVNPTWTANMTFWETRRIISAITQHITYNEFLPALVGTSNMKRYDLTTSKDGYYHGYDATYDASISNVWATAAFRFGHSMVKEKMSLLLSNYHQESSPIFVHETLFSPGPLLNVSANRDSFLIRGLLHDAAENANTFMQESLRSKMFLSDSNLGLDLFAINIERGREHGLPGYNKWRQYCGFKKALSFHDLSEHIASNKVAIFSKLYKHVDDIDLYIGGLAEEPVEGAAVGPTFACLNAEQFRALKKGDKAWFENPGSFSFEQLQEIRKTSLAGIICNDVAGMEKIQPNAMLLESAPGNKMIPCHKLKQMRFKAWKSKSPTHASGVLTRWFPKQGETNGQSVLTREIARHPDQICRGPLSYEVEKIDNEENSTQRIRFVCPPGSLAVTDFPKSAPGYTWTHWFDRDSPSPSNSDDHESLARLLIERPRHVCTEPMFIQAKTSSSVPALETNEVLEYFGPLYGLICKGSQQPSGRCSDYSVRFLCPDEFFQTQQKYYSEITTKDLVSWTSWMNLDDPNGKGDLEFPALARFYGKHVCRRPLAIEGRIAGSSIYIEDSNDVLKRYSAAYGIQCINEDQPKGQCHNYEVRYLCPARKDRERW